MVSQPPGFVNELHPDLVYLRQRSLYSLKQSPRMWYKLLWEFLIKLGFKESYSDLSLFISLLDEKMIYLSTYDDDIMVTDSDQDLV